MNAVIAAYPSVKDADLRLCEGVAFQDDMGARVRYDDSYFAKVLAYEGTPIARRVNAGRLGLVARHLPRGSELLDYGAGSGAFVIAARYYGFRTDGFDVMALAAARLRALDAFSDRIEEFAGVCFWDCLEHLEDPGQVVARVRLGGRAFVSIPVFEDLARVRASKHYRPGEHLYYWTSAGFVAWMARYGFELMETSPHEIDAGRESIGAFAFERKEVRP